MDRDRSNEQILAWLMEEGLEDIEDPSFIADDIESDRDSEHSQHPTDTEQSSSEIEGEVSTISLGHQLCYVGKDGSTKWNYNPTRSNVRTRAHNIVEKQPGVKPVAKNVKTILECFLLFVSEEMLIDIVGFTNIHIRKIKEKFSRERDCKEVDIIELKAFIGILYMAGIKKMNHLNLKEMWDNDGTAPDIFRAAMNRHRFLFLMRAIRFDDINSRSERTKYDNIDPIRELFESFVAKCRANYQVGENVTIDEMLESFRGRCKFRMYIANKPAKYGIKVYALCDSNNFYTSNLEIYPGNQRNGPQKYDNTASGVVKRLSQDILNTGRNITADNYFTSIPLADELLAAPTTIVGTLRKNKREIPPFFLDIKQRPKPSSIFGFHKGKVLVSYVPNKKNKKNILMISTLHNDDRIDPTTGTAAKPEIITFYNKTKGGVDVVDQLKEEYSVARVACRWPLRLFFTIINIARINSQIIYKENTGIIITRRDYLKQLALQLTQPHIQRRNNLQNISYPLQQVIKRFLPVSELPAAEKPNGICAVCPRRKNRKTKKTCIYCQKFLCTEHSHILCDICKAREYDED